MNFNEFQKKVDEMGCKLQEENVNPEDVKIGYTKATGENIIVALKSEYIVVAYFKW